MTHSVAPEAAILTSKPPPQQLSELASLIDHTLLKPDATHDQVLGLCAEAVQYRFACAMVNPTWVALAHSALAGCGIPVGTVIGFPLGGSLSTSKREESAMVLKLGARELDMVLNIGLLKSGKDGAVLADIRGVVELANDAGAVVKVILEMCLLSTEEKLRAAQLAVVAGAGFLKTSTGFSTSGATASDVMLLRGIAGPHLGVKAAGGIRTLADAQAMIAAGANRIGASASVQIIRELAAR
ncbi:MAG TPA: deoxyribose-phosphate aldolase [Acidisarcina sp.]